MHLSAHSDSVAQIAAQRPVFHACSVACNTPMADSDSDTANAFTSTGIAASPGSGLASPTLAQNSSSPWRSWLCSSSVHVQRPCLTPGAQAQSMTHAMAAAKSIACAAEVAAQATKRAAAPRRLCSAQAWQEITRPMRPNRQQQLNNGTSATSAGKGDGRRRQWQGSSGGEGLGNEWRI